MMMTGYEYDSGFFPPDPNLPGSFEASRPPSEHYSDDAANADGFNSAQFYGLDFSQEPIL
jgi:hypothetical protein